MTNRREVLQGAMAAALGASLARGARAAEGASSVDCMTILYPAGEGTKFDADYYRDRHIPLIGKLFGDSVGRIELRRVPPSPAGAPPARFAAAVNLYIDDAQAFQAANQRHGQTLLADVRNFTNAQPTIQFDRVHGEMGAPRAAIGVGEPCLTILYPNEEGVRWDVDYYRRGHMPLIMRLYGERAIKRFELRKGDAGVPGGRPAYIGTINIYIASQQAFDAAGKQHTKTLVDDVPNFSSVMPVAFPTVVHAVG